MSDSVQTTMRDDSSGLVFGLSGQVQGVGLRPLLFRIASEHNLKGLLYNHPLGATAELDGPREKLELFCSHFLREAKPPIEVRSHTITFREPQGFEDLRIIEKDHSASALRLFSVPPDYATCPKCWEDFTNPAHRLFKYPFISCTDCGPRWTILRSLPFERDQTSMVDFPLCHACLNDYRDPRDRRFHAQTLSCPECGPRLTLHLAGSEIDNSAALPTVQQMLRDGAVGLIKGVGGFQLVGNALDPIVIEKIRLLKSRRDRALAVMTRDEKTFRSYGGHERDWETMRSNVAPIVSVPRLAIPTRDRLAPDLSEIGIMAPTTPLHFLIMGELPLLIVTSGNKKGDALPRSISEITFQLGAEIDFILDHNREILNGIDDSVVRGGAVMRKARGLTPAVWPRRKPGATLLALGADMKNSAALALPGQIVELPYAGELGSLQLLERQSEAVATALRLFGAEPAQVAHDIHPSSLTPHLHPCPEKVRATLVPHHLAHALAAREETDADLILTFDGTGTSETLELWGGEGFQLHSSPSGDQLRRVLTLQATPLIGGDACVRSPWRSLVSMLTCAGWTIDRLTRLLPSVDQETLETHFALSARGFGPLCSSMGRWFDAAASLIEFGDREQSYEAQAPIRLEHLAGPFLSLEPLPAMAVTQSESLVVVNGPALLAQLGEWKEQRRFTTGQLAFLAHDQMAKAVAQGVLALSARKVATTGGVFQNELFFTCLSHHLSKDGVALERPSRIHVGDQSIALGQLAYLESVGEIGDTECTS